MQYGAPQGQFGAPQGQFGAPQGQYGAPQGQYGAPQQSPYGSPGGGASFDPKTVNPMDWGILAAGVLALLFSFFSYYTAKASITGLGSFGGHESAWHGFFGWFAALCALAGAAVLAVEFFAPQVKLPAPGRLITAGLFALATLCVLLALVVIPIDTRGVAGVNTGHGFGYWLSLIVIIAGLVLSILRLKATGGKLPWEKSGTGGNYPPQQWQQGGYPQQ